MSQPVIGAPLDRVEGPQKVTGTAAFTGDITAEGLAHAVVVTSTIARGRIASIDDARARDVEDAIEVLTHRNAPRVEASKTTPMASHLFLLQSDEIQFDRQPVAVAIAESFEAAVEMADLVTVRYETTAPVTDIDRGDRFVPQQIFGDPADRVRGGGRDALARAPIRLTETYRTPSEHHNPIETHGTVAHWDGDRLTLHDSTQWTFGVRSRLANVFGIPEAHVRVIAPYVGGAFGGKGQPWSHVPLAAMAAKAISRPVKLLVTRAQMFGFVGHRPQTVQTISLGADAAGKLLAVAHDVVSETSIADEYVEPCAVFSRDLYAVPDYAMSHQLSRLNISKPTFQRCPGESTGSFAMESAMDELAARLAIDPLELRRINYASVAPDSGEPYTSKKLMECYDAGASAFGWSKRDPQPASMRRDGKLIGYGMATALRGTHRSGASVRIAIDDAGDVTLSSGTIEQGTGSPTVFSQLAAEILEIPPSRVRFEWGDTEFPDAPLAAGSQTASSVGSAVVLAAQKLRERIAQSGVKLTPGGLVIEMRSEPDESEDRFEQSSFGAHFAEVEVDPDLRTVRVSRFVGAFDAGRILNAKTARSQFLGGIVWGISMALFEKTRYDLRTARIMNATLADYLVPTNADITDVEIITIEDDDRRVNPAGVRGIGEVAMSGSAAAVANAVYHATGIRVRELPITIEKLLV
jgi:xanthine dehydrogenase YagR molybdenum-binding subunit